MSAKAARILVTGFGPFLGAPENPTEWLVGRLHAEPPRGEGIGDFHAEVLDVEYHSVGPRLSALGAAFGPDIAIHFGLAREARGFRLERVARNSHAGARPDQAGGLPSEARICQGPDTLPSTLPLDEIAGELAARDLPVELSDDAGGYLCNTVFVLSRFHACAGLRPSMSGFIHVPAFGQGPESMTPRLLEAGARIAIAACAASWAGAN